MVDSPAAMLIRRPVCVDRMIYCLADIDKDTVKIINKFFDDSLPGTNGTAN